MTSLLFVLLLVPALVLGQQSVQQIEGIPWSWLMATQPGGNTNELLRPWNMRTIYRTVITNPAGGLQFPTTNDNIIVDGYFTTPANLRLRLIRPSPYNPSYVPTVADCNNLGVTLTLPVGNTAVAPPTSASPTGTPTNSQAQFRVSDLFLGTTEYPHEWQWPFVCIATDAVNFVPTNLRFALVRGCGGHSSTSEANGAAADLCANIAAATPTQQAGWGEVGTNGGNALFVERVQRLRCCGFQVTGTTVTKYGVCINPLLQRCCTHNDAVAIGTEVFRSDLGGGKPFSPFREKCCYGGSPISTSLTSPVPTIISYLDDWCPCQPNAINQFCNRQFPAAATQDCCTATKYSELTVGTWGKCFDGINQLCCNTGDLYDPGTAQCCAINGVQSLNIPCPCATDSHCGANQACCGDPSRPVLPTPSESAATCDPYITYPTGTARYDLVPCLGQCIDTRFQICCNGRACIDEFEVCCNNTCCNKFNQRCTMGWRSGAQGSRTNPLNYGVAFEICTTVEAVDPFRGVVVFFLPIILLLATVLGLATSLFFAKRQNTLQPLSVYEKSMFVLAALAILFAWPLYFSPLFKYGVVTIWVCFFVMVAALSQLRPLNIAAVIVLGVLLVYLVDPWYGNEILTLAYDRAPPPANAVHGYTGVLASIATQYLGAMNHGGGDCVAFYDYFLRDSMTEDRDRRDNPDKFTFGWCSRDWFTALGLFEVITILFVFLLFFVTLITHLRNVLFTKAEKTEEVVGWY